jgi:hypothetical protein
LLPLASIIFSAIQLRRGADLAVDDEALVHEQVDGGQRREGEEGEREEGPAHAVLDADRVVVELPEDEAEDDAHRERDARVEREQRGVADDVNKRAPEHDGQLARSALRPRRCGRGRSKRAGVVGPATLERVERGGGRRAERGDLARRAGRGRGGRGREHAPQVRGARGNLEEVLRDRGALGHRAPRRRERGGGVAGAARVEHVPVRHEHHAVQGVKHVRRGLVERGDDDSPARGDGAQRAQQAERREGVQSGGRLVEDEDARVGDELHADGHAAPLAAGDAAHAARAADGSVCDVAEAQLRERGVDARLDLAGRRAAREAE